MSRSRVIAWAMPEQLDLLQEAIDVAGLDLVAVVSDQPGGGADLAKALAVEHVAGLREAVHDVSADILFLAAPTSIEATERRLVRESGLVTFSLEPRPGEINALLSDPHEADTALVVPLMRHAESFRDARQVLGELAPPHGLCLTFRGRPEQGSLFARLFDVMDLVDHLCGDVESVGATLADPGRDATSSRRAVPESLTGLRGHMSLNFHFVENRCASAVISSESDSWFRGVTLLSGRGCLRLTDHQCLWSGTEGSPEEIGHPPDALTTSAGRLIGEAMRRALQERDPDEPPHNVARLLALCEAARLSCRTGQAESPSRMLAMMSHV